MDIRFITTLVLLPSLAVSSYVSKACFGTPGLHCTKHSLICKEGKIAIQDAYYTDNDISDTGERKDFNGTFTRSLYKHCSLERSCQFKDGKKRGAYNLSVVKYKCMNATTDICSNETVNGNNITLLWNETNNQPTCFCKMSTNHHTATLLLLDMRPKYNCSQLNITADGVTSPIDCSKNIFYRMPITSTKPIILHKMNVFDIIWIQIVGSVNGSCSTNMSTGGQSSIIILPTPRADDAHEGQGNGGAIAGGVTAVIIILIIVTGVFLWLKFIRKKKEKKPKNGNDNCASANSASITDVQHVSSRKTTSNYDYTTINDGVNPVGRAQNHFVPAAKPSTDNGTTVLMEDDYNHINHNPPEGASFPGYDTTASAAAAVKKLKNASSNSIDDDDYNHLGEGKPSVVSIDYDTTVSASKAVAQLGEMKDSEDDYDHFKRSEDSVIDSPYDTANHHSMVSADTTQSPYDLAK